MPCPTSEGRKGRIISDLRDECGSFSERSENASLTFLVLIRERTVDMPISSRPESVLDSGSDRTWWWWRWALPSSQSDDGDGRAGGRVGERNASLSETHRLFALGIVVGRGREDRGR